MNRQPRASTPPGESRASEGYDYIIWHQQGSCDHQNENVCRFCDSDLYFRTNYSRPHKLPGRGDRLQKKVIGDG